MGSEGESGMAVEDAEKEFLIFGPSRSGLRFLIKAERGPPFVMEIA